MENIDFELKNNGVVSKEFLNLKIFSFKEACEYIANLPYKRNSNKENINCVFSDLGGTCSTKHAVLRKLALENNHPEVKLILGIFKMDSEYTPLIKDTLNKNNLEYIPEAHNYLKINNSYYDFTRRDSNYNQFKNKLLTEVEIEYIEIATEKVLLHKEFLKDWIQKEKLNFTLDEIWKIREECISDLQKIV